MNSEGMIAFFTYLGLNMENCEPMIAVYLLGMPSILTITKSDFDQATHKFKSLIDLSAHVRREIQSKYQVSRYFRRVSNQSPNR